MVPRRQLGDEGSDRARLRVHRHDARAVVLSRSVGCLIGVGGEEPSALEAAFERDVDRRTRGLKAAGLDAAASGRLPQGACDLVAVLVEHQNVGGKRVARIEIPRPETPLFVAYAGQAVPRFQHVHLELLCIAEECDPRRHVQTLGEDRDLEPRGKNDVLASTWVK